MKISSLAGKPVTPGMLVNVPKLVAAYYTGLPDPAVPAQRVAFGTSGHRGSSFATTFNEHHVLAITQAICLYREKEKINGPLFLGYDTHALSEPAFATAVEVLAANAVELVIAGKEVYTPTPVISHAILRYNRNRQNGLSDGIVITPSHNPPDDGGFKYNPPHGGPAETEVTQWIEAKANELLEARLSQVRRISFSKALNASTTHRHDYLDAYVKDLPSVIDLELIRDSKIRMGVDPLGGAGVRYWEAIADRYGLDLTIVNKETDPAFRFMTADSDGQIRMDPSSPFALKRLIGMRERFDVAFACDTDNDRHGVVSPGSGLLDPNQYLSVAVYYLLRHRPQWSAGAAIGKTVVTTQLIDRIAARSGKRIYEVPVGFKWFAGGLLDGSLCFGGEESAGAVFSRTDGTVWTTDKDGFTPALLAAEITAKLGSDPGKIFQALAQEFGESYYGRYTAPVTPAQKKKLAQLSPAQLKSRELGGEEIRSVLTHAPGNNAPIGGIKVIAPNGWFAARPSGTENIYKIYGESFSGKNHLQQITREAQAIVDAALNEGRI